MAFPTNPNDGDEHTENGRLFYWDAAHGVWRLKPPPPPPDEKAWRYEHDQIAESKLWMVPHALGKKYVDTQVVDASGNTIICDVDWPASTDTIVHLTFCNAKNGHAVIRR